MEDRPPSSFDAEPEMFEANSIAKFGRKLKKEPLIPLGCAATCYALWRAYRSMKAGDSNEMNRMMRARIYAQGFTLVVVVAGGYFYGAERAQERELNKALEEKKQQAKKEAWLRELETRDQEDKEWRERHAAVESAAKIAEQKRPGASEFKRPTKRTPEPTEGTEPVETEEGKAEPKKATGVLSAVKELLGGSK